MVKAHLVVTFLVTKEQPFPQFYKAAICSDPAQLQSAGPYQINSEVFHQEGETFMDAKEKMIYIIEQTPWLKWAWAWVSPNQEAHRRRISIDDERKIRFEQVQAANEKVEG